MGKLKKSVRGLVVVHPMTALGREMGLQEMTGFSKTAFLSSFLVAVTTATHDLLAPAGTCRSLCHSLNTMSFLP